MAASKRWTTLLDLQGRASHKALLIFAGLETTSSGAVSVAKIQKILLKDFPALLNNFPDYQKYFALSTWIALIAGVLFLLYLITITLWIARVFVGMSLLYLILGSFGVLAISLVAFYVCYVATLVIVIGSQLAVLQWYLRNTKLDGFVLVLLQLGLIIWAFYEMTVFA